MLLFAWHWWELRVVFIDMAYHLFEILRHDNFTIQNHRFAAFATQSVPLLLSRVAVPLETLAVAYSLAFPIFYFLVFLLCWLVLKSPRVAMLMLFANILIVTDTFFWIQSELPQGIAWMTLGLALLDRSERKWPVLLESTIAVVLIITAAFAHPLLVFPFGFIVIFILLHNSSGFDRWKVLGAGLLFAGVALIKKRHFQTEYDEKAMEGVKLLEELFPHYLTLETTKEFIKDCFTIYYWLPIVLILVAVYCIAKKQWLTLLWVYGFFAGYALLVCVSSSANPPQRFYIENMFLPLGLIVAVPLVFELLPWLQNKRLDLAFTALIILTFFIRIQFASEPFTERLTWVKGFTEKFGEKKLIVATSALPVDTLLMTWGIPYETWLVSMYKNGTVSSLNSSDNPDQWRWALDRRDAWITQLELVPYNELPSRYFNFTDSVSTYKIVDGL